MRPRKKRAIRRAINDLRDRAVIEIYSDWAWLADKADDTGQIAFCPRRTRLARADGHGHTPIGVPVCPVRVSQSRFPKKKAKISDMAQAYHELLSMGVHLSAAAGGKVHVKPKSKITDQVRWLVSENRTEILQALADKDCIRQWLCAIGEHDPVTIDEILKKARAEPEARSFYLGQADKILPTDSAHTSERERDLWIAEKLANAPRVCSTPALPRPVVRFSAYRNGWQWREYPTGGRNLSMVTKELQGLYGVDVKVDAEILRVAAAAEGQFGRQSRSRPVCYGVHSGL